MSRQHSLILSLTLVILNFSTSAEAKPDCINCGLDGRKVNDTRTVILDRSHIEFSGSSIIGGRVIVFESFEDYENINGLNLGGVTLIDPISDIVEIYSNNRCGALFHSPKKSISTNECTCITNPLIGIFDYPATYIGLWGGDGGEDTDSWELEAFDSPIDGNSLGIVSSGDWNGNPYRRLEINALGIWRFEARSTGVACGVAYDDLEFFIPLLLLTKNDDVNDGDCVIPDREINYTITYSPEIQGNSEFSIIDYLPVEVNYNSSSPLGDYNEIERTLTWNMALVPQDGNGIITVKTFVNEIAEPCGIVTNLCELKRNDLICNVAEVNASICCWDPGVIYVNADANGRNTGMSWEDAYLDLQDALNRASCGGGSQIWVATGTYKPSVPNPSTFQLINNIPLYGHFEGNETSVNQRDLNDPNSETVLSGEGGSSYRVVTASGISQNNILDGFTIIGGYYDNVLISNASLLILNCIITNGLTRGIWTGNGGVKQIDNCKIYNNNNIGIAIVSSSLTIIKKCKIYANNNSGITISGSSNSNINNNWIFSNEYDGINLGQWSGSSIIWNNTIVDNNRGIGRSSSGSNPIITSCVIWGNTSSDLYNCSATYSYLTANGDPCFVNADENNFHLRPESLCIDAGDPCFLDFDETDIDGDPRIKDGDGDCVWRVDIGADEFAGSFADFNKDGLVNFLDFALWANSWLTFDPAKSFDSDGYVDINDLAMFCEEWLSHGPNPDFDLNNTVDFFDFGLLADSWQLFDAERSLDEDCDVDLDDLAIFCGYWLSESPW